HTLDAPGSQTLEDLAVERQQAFEQIKLVELAALALAQPQVGQWADQHRLEGMPQGLALLHLFEQLFPAQAELLIRADFGDQVVVVGIEPFGHLLRVSTAAAGALADAPRHAEQGVQAWLAAVNMEALGDHAEHQRVSQYLVVPGEIADRQQVDASLLLQLPVGSTQLTAD